MTTDVKILRDELRDLLKSPALGLSDYAADPMVGRRVGHLLANAKSDPRTSGPKIDGLSTLDPSRFKPI